MKYAKEQLIWGMLRILMGFTFFWAFIDKLFGLGFATCANKATGAVEIMCSSAWINGGSPTVGFLKFATKGPFAELFQGLAGNPIIDWTFMLGLGLIGLSLLLGVGVEIASFSGALMMLLMYLAAIQPANNPLIDDHIIYIFVLAGLAFYNAGLYLGLGRWWQGTKLVKKFPFLR